MRTLPRRLAVAIIVAVIVAFLSIKLNAFRDYQIAQIAVEVTRTIASRGLMRLGSVMGSTRPSLVTNRLSGFRSR